MSVDDLKLTVRKRRTSHAERHEPLGVLAYPAESLADVADRAAANLRAVLPDVDEETARLIVDVLVDFDEVAHGLREITGTRVAIRKLPKPR